MRKMSFCLIFLLVSFFIWIAFKGLPLDPHQLPSPLINQLIPKFKLPLLPETTQFEDEKLFKQGKVSLLHVWASWCVVCEEEQPTWMTIHKTYPQMIIYGLNYKDRKITANQWLKRLGNPYKKVLFDPQGQLGLKLGVYGTPETFLLDTHGVIRYKHIGKMTFLVWRQSILPKINKLLQE